MTPLVIVGGAGFVGDAIVEAVQARGGAVHVVDRAPPRREVPWTQGDLLVDDLVLPPGDVVLAHGSALRTPLRPWTVVPDHVFATLRLLPALEGRRVTLISTHEADFAPDLDPALDAWITRARRHEGTCPPWRVATLCRALAGLAPDRVFGLCARVRERLLPDARILRFGRIFGPGRHDPVVRAIRAGSALPPPVTARAEVAARVLDVPADGLFDAEVARVRAWLAHDPPPVTDPPIPVVIPPRPADPERLADRQQQALWTGALKYGGRWSTAVERQLADRLRLDARHTVRAVVSGTEALRLAVLAVAGLGHGRTAALPAFTYPATAEVLVQLGWRLRWVDVTPDTWTLCPVRLADALAAERVALVVTVDTFGCPSDYAELGAVCAAHGVPLVADSAAALGAAHAGVPVGSQAAAHAFSMSFAKTVSAAGSGGAVVLPAGFALPPGGWDRAVGMGELHAAAALDGLEGLDGMVTRREVVARRYEAATPAWSWQAVRPGDRHARVHQVACLPDRARWLDRLPRAGVQVRTWFEPLAHAPAAMPVTARLGASVLALPMSSELDDEAVDRVVDALR